MNPGSTLSALLYDPFLHLAVKSIRRSVQDELKNYQDKALLDLCCGTGNQMKILARNGFTNLHCVDFSPAMLEVARKGDHSINMYLSDATATPFADDSFDGIIISFAIHEKDRITQESLLAEAYRLLKNDGILLIVDYIFDQDTSRLGKAGIWVIERMAGGDHYRNFSKYINRNGLQSLISFDQYKLIRFRRKLFSGVILAIYQKKSS